MAYVFAIDLAVAVIRIMFTAAHPCEGFPRERAVRFLELPAGTTPARFEEIGIDKDTVRSLLADEGFTDPQVVDTALVCSRCRNSWHDDNHENC